MTTFMFFISTGIGAFSHGLVSCDVQSHQYNHPKRASLDPFLVLLLDGEESLIQRLIDLAGLQNNLLLVTKRGTWLLLDDIRDVF